ncbi:MAG: hypothetical protein OXU42_17320 [Deltaproteobacteria bacterium]|nr:hypothetical protein [Deltaproteobacteria bacterium]
MKLEGLVRELVPQCTCEFVKQHHNADMVVFSVPRPAIRVLFAALAALPVVGATVYVAARTGFVPPAVSEGPLSPIIHGGLLALVLGVGMALVVSIANMRMHAGRDYVFGVLKNLSIVFGVLSFLRMLEGVLP